MKLPVSIDVRFERVVKDASGKSGKVHITLNGAPLCEMWSRQAFQQHKSGIDRVSIQDFIENPCGRTANGTPGNQGCWTRIQP